MTCQITSESIPDTTPSISCEDLVDLLALEVGSCFDQVSGVLQWRVVSGGSLYVQSEEPIVIGVSSSEMTELGQDEIIPLEECAVANLGDGAPGNDLDLSFSSGIAVFGEHWKKRFYDSNQDCFIDARDLIDFIEAPSGGIIDATRSLEEFSTFWYD